MRKKKSISLWFAAHLVVQLPPSGWTALLMWCLWSEFKTFPVRLIQFMLGFCFCNNKSCNSKQDRYLLDLVVAEEVKAWTQRITGAQGNESNWHVTHFILSQQNIHQRNAQAKLPPPRPAINQGATTLRHPTWSGLRSNPVTTSCKVPSPPATISMSVCSMTSISFLAWPS